MNGDILVEQTLAGDKQAFNSLITDYYADVYGMILSWVKNPEDAKDLTQDVFISAYLDLPSLRDHEQFYSWLKQIARHKCQNWKRKQIDFVPLHDDLISKEPSTDEVLILRETLAKVMEAIDNLPESEKRLLKEHYLDNVSYDELEARHGVSAKALVVRLVRARRKIRDQLEKTLSAFAAFLHDHTESILTGGMEIMKLSVKTKLIAGGIMAILLLGGAGVLVDRYYVQNRSKRETSQTSQENYSKSPVKSVSDAERSSIKGVNSLDQKGVTREKVQAEEFKAETLAMNESKGDKSTKDADYPKVIGSSTNESKELTPEIKQKVELYTELASILPEYKRLWAHLLDMPAGDKNRTNEELALVKRSYELDMEIVKMCESFLHSPAIMKDERGIVQQMNIGPMFAQIAEHLGKELPFDGNKDYFSAEDYKGGEGGF